MRSLVRQENEDQAFGLLSLFNEQFTYKTYSESFQAAEDEADSILAKAKFPVEKARQGYARK